MHLGFGLSKTCLLQASLELQAMQTKNERLAYRLQHLLQAVKDSDADLAVALSDDHDKRKQLQSKHAHLLHQPPSQVSANS